MKRAVLLEGLMLAAVALVVTGCDTSPVDKKSGAKQPEHVHGKGPNGGTVFDLGNFHAEFTIDHGKKECMLVILAGDDESKPVAVAAKDLTITTKPTKSKDGKAIGPMTIKLTAQDAKDGKATRYVGTDPGLGIEAEHEGSVTGVLDGKPSQGTFKED